MRYRTAISVIVAAVLALTTVPTQADAGKGGSGAGDRDQQMDRDRDYDRDRDRVQDHVSLDTRDRDRDRDRDQDHDKDQARDRDRDRDRLHVNDPLAMSERDIYGSELMTQEEMNQYRKKLANMNTVQTREQFQVQHEKQMQERAKAQGKDLVPPGQGAIYGAELMTVQERNQFREQLRQLGTEKERRQFLAQHREKMDLRAKALELEVEEAE